MSKNKLLLAAAGSGKTTYILENVQKLRLERSNKKIIIVTYTTENQESVRRKLIEKHGFIPDGVMVMGWFSFLLEFFIRPFKGTVIPKLYDRHVGLAFVANGSGTGKSNNGSFYSLYGKGDLERKFLNKTKDAIYSDKLSEFACLCCRENEKDFTRRTTNILKAVFIDEAQDLAGWDYEIIKILCRISLSSGCILCGDVRQRTYKTSNGQKYKNFDIFQFVTSKMKDEKYNIDIDERSLNLSHRCVEDICNFASSLTPQFPPMRPCSCETCCERRSVYDHRKGVFLIRKRHLASFIREYNPVTLIWDRRSMKHVKTEQYFTFGRSKGLEFDSVLIVPTKVLLNFLSSNDGEEGLSKILDPKCYVAFTRARFAVAIILEDTYEAGLIKLKFWKPEFEG